MEQIERISINKLKVNPKNPRIVKDFKFKQLVKSLLVFPEMLEKRPVIYDENQVVLGGNVRLRGFQHIAKIDIEKELKSYDLEQKRLVELLEFWTKWQKDKKVPCLQVLWWTDEQKNEFIIKDNVGFGEWDFDALANEWDSSMLADWGLDLPIGGLDNAEDDANEASEDDYVPPKEIKTDIVLGDLFEIGEHRLLCGDCTDSDSVAKLMNGEKAEISFTSPPYNVGKNTNLSNGAKYINNSDTMSDDNYLELLIAFTNNAIAFSDYVFVNIQSLSNNKIVLIDYLYQLKSFFADTIIWDKEVSQPAMGTNVLNSQFEYIHIFSQKANRAIGCKEFRGTISNILRLNSRQDKDYSNIHKATFPIALPISIIGSFTNTNSIVMDTFLGTGTTMVAAHQLNRKCYGIELEPQYCQLIIERMCKLDNCLTIKKNGIDVTNEFINP